MSESAPYLIVDGHSVIHAWPDLARLHRTAARRHLARSELIKRLTLLQDVTGERVVIVFDGTGSKTSEERGHEGVQIFYADAQATADAVVERLAVKYAKIHRLTVASADGMVRDSILASGAEWISPEKLRLRYLQAADRCAAEIKRLRSRD